MRHPVFVAECPGLVDQHMRIQLAVGRGIIQAYGRGQCRKRQIIERGLAAVLSIERVARRQILHGQAAGLAQMLHITEVP